MKGRLVVLPNWQGLGIGGRLDDWAGEWLYDKGYDFDNTIAHPGMMAYYGRSPRWQELGPGRRRGLALAAQARHEPAAADDADLRVHPGGMKTFVGAKLHGLRVTDTALDYHGSVAIDSWLLNAAGIDPFERVTIVNLSTGARWDTYALPSMIERAFVLQGGSARLGEIGDACVVMSWVAAYRFEGARVLMLDEHNAIAEALSYP